MGGALSCGEDNDDLVNILKINGYILSKKVERVFRAVDRGDYILQSHHDLAYKDMSCKVGNIHLSAPCVYSTAMEELTLYPGLSFLNIGSGTGYLSTMAGLILGQNGTNHGIEMHEDCLTYAYEHLEEFKKKSLDVDVFEFCEPVFQHGNFLNAMPNRQYDRVYCGAACPEAHEKFVKQFVKIGGILVMPYKDHLLRAKRTGEKSWSNTSILPVSFASLMPPQDGPDRCLLQLPLWKPKTLQELCRNSIRSNLRKILWSENRDLEYKRPISLYPKERSRAGMMETELRSGLGSFIDEGFDAHQRDVVATTLELVMGSSMRAIFTEGPSGAIYLEHTDSSSDSEDVLESEIERLFARRESEQINLTKEGTENSEDRSLENSRETSRPRTDDDDEEEEENSMEIGLENYKFAKEAEDVEMKEEATEGESVKQGGSNYGRASGSNMKRKSTDRGSNESSEDSGEERNTRAREEKSGSSLVSDTDDLDDESDLDFVLIKKVYSMINAEPRGFNVNSDSSTSSSSDDDEPTKTARCFVKNSKARGSEETQNTGGPISNGNEAGKSEFTACLLDPRPERRTEEIGLKKRLLSTLKSKTIDHKNIRNEDESKEKEKINDSADHEVDIDGSDLSSDMDETHAIMNYRRGYRVGRKRRSDRKFLSSGNSGTPKCGKKSYKSESSDSAGTENSFKTDSTASTSAESPTNTIYSDSDGELSHMRNNSRRKQIFVHTINKDVFSCIMKKKINQLPLPPPLRLYINYNREL